MAVYDKLKNDEFFIAILAQEWFVIQQTDVFES